MGVTGIDWQG